MRRLLILLAGLLALAVVAVSSSGTAVRQDSRWVVTDLGTLGGSSSFARAINNRGLVVGRSMTHTPGRAGEPTHPFIWSNGRMTDLGFRVSHGYTLHLNESGHVIGLAGGYGFAWWRGSRIRLVGDHRCHGSGVQAINDAGQTVGVGSVHLGRSGCREVPYLWERPQYSTRGSPVLMHEGVALSTRRGAAYAVNERGQVVGWSYPAPKRASLWESGRATNLGTLGGESSSALAINEQGEIVGRSQVDGGFWHAFLWQNGEMRDLGTLPGWPHSYAVGINDERQVIGSNWGNAGRYCGERIPERRDAPTRAFLWQDGEMLDLGTLGGAHTIAYAINGSGLVVGASQTAGGRWRAFVWQTGALSALPGLGGRESCARDVNDMGQIIGRAETKNGDFHAVLWTPRR